VEKGLEQVVGEKNRGCSSCRVFSGYLQGGSQTPYYTKPNSPNDTPILQLHHV
jgi:hypothetical protein